MSKVIFIENEKMKAFVKLQEIMGVKFTRVIPTTTGILIETKSNTIADLLETSLRLI